MLTERVEGGMTQWRCRVGHRYSPDTLADAQAEGIEAALWAAVRALEDREALLRRMAGQARARSQHRSARGFQAKAKAAAEHADQVRDALRRAAATTLRSVDVPDDLDEEGTAA